MKFLKEERLKSQKTISLLFKEGRSFTCYPLRLVYAEVETTADAPFPIQFSVTVAKRNFKRAVDRNVLRRRIREAYRLHKETLYNFLQNLPENSDMKNKHFAFMVMYVAKEELPFAEIEKGIKKMIYKFEKTA
jgi:ribonuclease P protein component